MIIKQSVELEIKYLEDMIHKFAKSAKRYINCEMWSAAMLELESIISAKEDIEIYKKKLAVDNYESVPILERIRNGVTYMEENNGDPKYVAMNNETKNELFKELKDSRVIIPMTLSFPSGRVKMCDLEIIIKESILAGHIEIIGDDIK